MRLWRNPRLSIDTESTSMFEYQQPDALGHFGIYGGSFAAETLSQALGELKDAYARYQNDPDFLAEYHDELAHYVGRPLSLIHI